MLVYRLNKLFEKMNNEIESIWQDFNKELKSFVVSKVGNSSDADDVLQNAFIKIMQNIDKVKNAKNMRQYLYGIVRNSTIDFIRSKKDLTTDLEEQIEFSIDESKTLNTTIADCCVKPFINKLPDKYKDALLATEFQNVSQKELAERMNLSYSGLKSRVQRGREKLKDLLVECCALKSDNYGNLIEKDSEKCSC